MTTHNDNAMHSLLTAAEDVHAALETVTDSTPTAPTPAATETSTAPADTPPTRPARKQATQDAVRSGVPPGHGHHSPARTRPDALPAVPPPDMPKGAPRSSDTRMPLQRPARVPPLTSASARLRAEATRQS